MRGGDKEEGERAVDVDGEKTRKAGEEREGRGGWVRVSGRMDRGCE